MFFVSFVGLAMNLELITPEQAALIKRDEGMQACELVTIKWPDGERVYAWSDWRQDQVYRAPLERWLAGRGFEVAFLRNDRPGPECFHQIRKSSSISDDQAQMIFSDLQKTFRNRIRIYGTGQRVEFFRFFPTLDLAVSLWHGHLARAKRRVGVVEVTVSAGFSSPQRIIPGRPFTSECQAIYPPEMGLTDLVEIQRLPCEYDRHAGGNAGNLDSSGEPITFCEHTRANCTTIWGDDSRYLAVDVTTENTLVGAGQHKTVSATIDNRLRLQGARLGVPYGRCAALEPRLIQFRREEPPGSNKSIGTLVTEFAVGEGPIVGIDSATVETMGRLRPEGVIVRNGTKQQTGTGFTANSKGHSLTIKYRHDLNPIDPRYIDADQIRSKCKISGGRNTLRIVQPDGTFQEGYSENALDVLFDLLTDKRYGMKYDLSTFPVADLQYTREWAAGWVEFTDDYGRMRICQRAQFNGYVAPGQASEVINGLCLATRILPPFAFGQFERLIPLDRVELANIPEFTDRGRAPTILLQRGHTTLEIDPVPDDQLVNQVLLIYTDSSIDFAPRQLTLKNVTQQRRAGRARGDTTEYVVEKSYSVVGPVTENEAVRLAMFLRDLGPLDSGGIKNNCPISFLTPAWWSEALSLHQGKVIRVLSDELADYNEETGRPFEYFRVLDIEIGTNQLARVRAIAYPVDYFARMDQPYTGATPEPGTTPDPVFTGNPDTSIEYGGSTVFLT